MKLEKPIVTLLRDFRVVVVKEDIFSAIPKLIKDGT